jgi:hypothetical protein
MAATTPQVKENICTDPNKPLYPPFKVDSEFWFSWLREPSVKSFHFESECGKFTARKEERATSSNEYWYAYRKFQGKLRKVYLGAMDELTSDRLNQIAAEISQSGQDYYYSRKGYTTKKEKSCVTSDGDSTLTSASKSYPIENKESCVTDSSELEVLRLELDQLRSQLAAADQAIAISRVIQERTDNSIGELMDKIRSKTKGYKDNGFSQGIKDITQLAESRLL